MDTTANIYLDYNSTTPVDDDVLKEMLPFFNIHFANAASKTHFPGRFANEAVEIARSRTADFLGAEKNEIIFTSGSTESINLALQGSTQILQQKGNQIITWQTEHKAVLDTCTHLKKIGFDIIILPVDRDGLPDLNLLEKSITQKTILISCMLANNETGVVMPVEEISKIAHSNNCLMFCDATQAAGKMRIDVNELGVDLLCISAHKMYGPKGVGALYIRRKNPRVTLQPLIFGGGHENGIRSGTLNVPGIVGLGKACENAVSQLWETASQISRLRTMLEQILTTNGRGYVNGSIKSRIHNTSNICFPGIKSSELITAVPHLAIATGSACTSVLQSPSHVLMAMGLSESEAYSSVRFSLGKQTNEDEIITASSALINIITKLKSIN